MRSHSKGKGLLKTADMMRLAKVGRNTLRFYEAKGLIKEAARTQSGYRLYSSEALRDLRFIQDAKACGFSLKETDYFLSIQRAGSSTCGAVSKNIETKISEIDALIAQLTTRKSLLNRFFVGCRSNDQANLCEIRGEGFQDAACCGTPGQGAPRTAITRSPPQEGIQDD